MGLISRIEN